MCSVAQSCPTLCDPKNCSPPDTSVHGDSLDKNTGVGCSSMGPSQPRDWTQVSHIAGGFFTVESPGKPINYDKVTVVAWKGHGFPCSVYRAEAWAGITVGSCWSGGKPRVSGAMCRRRRGAGNKNQEPCRDFQEGLELRLEGTKERWGECMRMILEVGPAGRDRSWWWCIPEKPCLPWHSWHFITQHWVPDLWICARFGLSQCGAFSYVWSADSVCWREGEGLGSRYQWARVGDADSH